MWIRRYRAPDMPAALERIRSDLGPEAMILETRQVRTGGLMRFLRPPMVEVLVALDNQRGASRDATPSGGQRESTAAPQSTLDRLAQEVNSLRDNVRRLEQGLSGRIGAAPAARHGGPGEWLAPQQVESRFSAELCAAVLEKAGAGATPDSMESALLACLEERIPTTGPIQLSSSGPTVLCLVGPTGVGKTTTLAKLAAFAVKAGERVAMVTMDTFRVGAAAQLGTYAEIMGIPLQVAYSPEELRRQVSSQSDRNLILIDTPGCSHLNRSQLEELRAFLQAVPECTIHAAVAVSTDYREMLRAVDAFRVVPLSALVLTKLDETTRYGPALSLLRHSGLPASYVTHGQRVPDDLAIADAAELARLLTGGLSEWLRSSSHGPMESEQFVSWHPRELALWGLHERRSDWHPVAQQQGAAI